MINRNNIVILGSSLLITVNVLANHNSPESLEARIGAVGHLNVSDESAAATGDSGPVDGATTYNQSCAACHGAGVGGAPVLGEVDDWTARAQQGIETLYDHAVAGFQGSTGVMPAKGGNPALSDAAVHAAVLYMLEQVEGLELEGTELEGMEQGTSEESDSASTDDAATEQTVAASGDTQPQPESTAGSAADGEAIYKMSCFACHDAGIAGAPAMNNAEAWAGRVDQGLDVMVDHAINGFQGNTGVMPPKGGNPGLTDEEITAAVQYMVNQVQ